MESVDLSKLVSKIDSQKIEELSKLLDLLPQLTELLQIIKELKETGTLDVVLDFIYTIREARDMLTDDVLQSLASLASWALDLVKRLSSNSAFVDKVVDAITSDEMEQALQNPPKVTLGGIIKMLRDPDVQRGLGIVFSILKALGAEAKSR